MELRYGSRFNPKTITLNSLPRLAETSDALFQMKQCLIDVRLEVGHPDQR